MEKITARIKPVAKNDPDRQELLARMCAQVAYENRATDIEVLDIGKICSYADFFIIATGETRNQLAAIAEDVETCMESSGCYKLGIEGLGTGEWVLLDYGDVIVQLFEPEARTYYQFDELWGDAERLDWTPAEI